MIDRMRRTVAIGALMATAYSGYALLLFLVRGSQPFESAGSSLVDVVLTYYAAGVIGGGLVGAMLPLGRTLLGSLLIGFVAGVTFFFCIETATTGAFWHWEQDAWNNVLVLGGLFGGGGALIVRRGLRM